MPCNVDSEDSGAVASCTNDGSDGPDDKECSTGYTFKEDFCLT